MLGSHSYGEGTTKAKKKRVKGSAEITWAGTDTKVRVPTRSNGRSTKGRVSDFESSDDEGEETDGTVEGLKPKGQGKFRNSTRHANPPPPGW
jgi:hypothetical protein